jgi:hypothetical protein
MKFSYLPETKIFKSYLLSFYNNSQSVIILHLDINIEVDLNIQ